MLIDPPKRHYYKRDGSYESNYEDYYYYSPPKIDYEAWIDTETIEVWAPYKILKKILAEINGELLKNGQVVVDCAHRHSLPHFTFVYETSTYDIGPKDYTFDQEVQVEEKKYYQDSYDYYEDDFYDHYQPRYKRDYKPKYYKPEYYQKPKKCLTGFKKAASDDTFRIGGIFLQRHASLFVFDL